MFKILSKAKVCLSVMLLISFLALQSSAFASPTRLPITMNKGGSWTFTSMDIDEFNKLSDAQKRSLNYPVKIEYIDPTTTQKLANDMLKDLGYDKIQSGVKLGIDTALALGVEAAKKKLIAVYGESSATKMIPYLQYFVWGKMAYDVITDMADGFKAIQLQNAASRGTGLIRVEHLRGNISWNYWDGSSNLGSYPTVYVNPNNLVFGKINVK